MSAEDLLSLLTQIVFVTLGISTLVEYLRYRDEARRDTMLAFASIAIPIAISLINRFITLPTELTIVSAVFLIGHPYFLLRLTKYFQPLPFYLTVIAILGMVIIPILFLLNRALVPAEIAMAIILYFVVFDGYSMLVFVRGAILSSGIARKRLRFAAAGAGLLALVLILAGIRYFLPELYTSLSPFIQISAISAGLAFYFGFATPRWLRRTWQYDELRSFLTYIGQQPVHTHSLKSFVNELCTTANEAVTGLASFVLAKNEEDHTWEVIGSNQGQAINMNPAMLNDSNIINKVWQTQKECFISEKSSMEKLDDKVLPRTDANAFLIIPVTSLEHMLGVLVVMMSQDPLFLQDDLALLRLLAQQAAVFLKNMQLLEETQLYSEGLKQTVSVRTSQLRESEARFQNIFEYAAVGIAHRSLEGSYLEVNERFCQILGYSTEEAQNLTVDAITHPEDLPSEHACIEQLLQGNIPNYSIQKRYTHKEGYTVWADVTTSLVRKPGGEPDYFITVLLDITSQLESEAAQQTAEARFARVLDTTAEAVISVDNSYKIILFNKSAERIFGYSSEEMIGRSLDILLPPGMAQAHHHYMTAFAEGDDIARGMGQRGRELSAKDKSGRVFPIEASVSKLTEGEQVILTVFIQDVTERRKAREALLRINEELEQRVAERTSQLQAANKELEAFSYSVSHDLRAPLRAIDGFSQAILEDYEEKLDEDGQEFLSIIRAESQRMGQLIDDLLDLSRLSRTALNQKNINLSTIVTEIAQELQKQHPNRQVEFVIEEDLWACADARLIRIALQNLLGNAWKYSGKQKVACIEFGMLKSSEQTEDEETGTIYYVRDNGIGFNMDYVHKLFGAFQRLHSSSEFEGTGIGLATVQRIIHQHGGTIRAEGVLHEGATFYFSLGRESCA
ncbi:PAS domain S-box protein [Phototrophicus methaneseepsis]|uniref:histidine kinase n=1 Tax=Phototrophicus methaneseepsis TaxID=2710758 RepID=A0A7S8E6I2_9CHLR|nr:PAS domain S-box protein [Phototrophicus methaneseepsis]QPC81281.1 PAS domain S-box protein [Phototrophicus methaneseepsis]